MRSHRWRLPGAETATMELWPFVEPDRETIVDGDLASGAWVGADSLLASAGYRRPRARSEVVPGTWFSP